MIQFIVKPDIDYSKYGFTESSQEWTTWTTIRKLTIKKCDWTLHFNMPNLADFKIFMEMVQDGLVKCVDRPYRQKGRYHYLNLSDEEYNLIQERRNKENADEWE